MAERGEHYLILYLRDNVPNMVLLQLEAVQTNWNECEDPNNPLNRMVIKKIEKIEAIFEVQLSKLGHNTSQNNRTPSGKKTTNGKVVHLHPGSRY